MAKTTIIIPARTEKFLNTTIDDILKKATGDIEIMAVLDGYGDYPYEQVQDKRVKYIELPLPDNFERRKRQGINTAVSICNSKYVCWMDAHCVVAQGFDEVLARDCEDDMAMVPRRWRLNVEQWDKEGWIKDDGTHRPPIDYEYFMWQKITKEKRFAGYRWDKKSEEKKNVMIDDIFTAQGSFFFMTKKWFEYCKLMKLNGYTGWGQEGEEVCLTTIQNGGRAVVDKNTWYAHMHKGQMHGRMYKWTSVWPSYDYSYNYWVWQNRDFFEKIIDRFGLFPNWPDNWQKKIYGNQNY